ncbi:hypothetical protein IWQ61_008562 [Dispira simplex]|nr:hypothetical protein IWQ61_008562 [Dispira simplex]
MRFAYLGTVATFVVAAVVSPANAESCSVREIYHLSAITSLSFQLYQENREYLKKYTNSSTTSLIDIKGNQISNLLKLCKQIDEKRSHCNPLKKLASHRISKCRKIREISESTDQDQPLTETDLSANTGENVHTGLPSA